MFDLTKNERPLMDDFASLISFKCYKYKDQDTGAVRPPSEWDLLIFANNKAVIIEGKKEGNWLTETQKLASMRAEKAGNNYYILVFGKKYKDKIMLTDRKRTFCLEGLEEIFERFRVELKEV